MSTAAAPSSPTPRAQPVREIPRYGSVLFGWPAFRRDPLGTLTEAARSQGEIAQMRFGPLRVVLLTGPAQVQHVLLDNHRNYSKRTRGYDALRMMLGNGLVTAEEGDFWRRQRRIAQPAFHRQRIADFAASMAELAAETAAQWCQAAEERRVVDVAEDMTVLTLRIVGRTLLSTEVDAGDANIGRAVDRMNAFARDMMTNPFSLPQWVPTPRNREFKRLRGELDRVVFGIIEGRRRTGDAGHDLLSMFMSAVDSETGESMNDAQLRDEVMTMFMAGHETTANALSWTLYLLSTHPDVRRKLQRELDEVLGGRVPTLDDLPRLPYVRAVVAESMRLYPSVWSIGRRAESEDVIDGYRIRAGTLVILSSWVTHRQASLWPNPEGFDPQRFIDPAPKRHRYAYYPFGGGPRQCIGNTFAIMEAEIVLATLLRHVEPELVPGYRAEPQAFITLQPKGGMPMRMRPRTCTIGSEA